MGDYTYSVIEIKKENEDNNTIVEVGIRNYEESDGLEYLFLRTMRVLKLYDFEFNNSESPKIKSSEKSITEQENWYNPITVDDNINSLYFKYVISIVDEEKMNGANDVEEYIIDKNSHFFSDHDSLLLQLYFKDSNIIQININKIELLKDENRISMITEEKIKKFKKEILRYSVFKNFINDKTNFYSPNPNAALEAAMIYGYSGFRCLDSEEERIRKSKETYEFLQNINNKK